jgi:hypothetical protein
MDFLDGGGHSDDLGPDPLVYHEVDGLARVGGGSNPAFEGVELDAAGDCQFLLDVSLELDEAQVGVAEWAQGYLILTLSPRGRGACTSAIQL